MSNQDNQPLIDSLTVARDDAAKALEVAAKRFRANASGPMADIYEDDMDLAFEALTVAGRDLREVRDGYRVSHPRGCGHPGHANCICHNAGTPLS